MAAITAAVLIFVGWLGARHEAQVAHVHDPVGRLVHAQQLADHHAPDAATHLHGRAEHDHASGACALIATLLARTTPTPAPSGIAVAAIAPEALPADPAVPPAIAPYRLAPKTSPPDRA